MHGVLSLTWHLCPAVLSESIRMDARQVTVLLTVGEMTPSWFIGEAGRVFMRAGSSPLQVMWRSLNEMLRVCHLLSFPLMP